MSTVNIASNLIEMFSKATQAAADQGYNYMVLFPRDGLGIFGNNELRARTLAAQNSNMVISLKDVSENFISAKIGFDFQKITADRDMGQYSNLSFAAFKTAAEQTKLLERVKEFDFHSDEKVYALPYSAGKDELPQTLAITGSGTYSFNPDAFR